MTKKVIQWFIDALLVNVGATAFRPDKTKVSNPQTLQNISVALLKLCEPFMNDSSRIHPGNVSSPSHHKGVFVETGDDAVPRLAENPDCPTEPYAPKNTFIPQIFFLCARSLHLSVVSSASYHTSIVRQVNHMAWSLRQRNADLVTDPNFNQILTMQYCNEVSLLAPGMVQDSLRFFNLTAGFLLQIDNKSLSQMPEHFVEDFCDYLVFVARFASKEMTPVEFGNIFRAVVKLLSPELAHVSVKLSARAMQFELLCSCISQRNGYHEKDCSKLQFTSETR